MHPNSNSPSKNPYRCGEDKGEGQDDCYQDASEWQIHFLRSLRCKEGRFLVRGLEATRLPFQAVPVLSRRLLQAQGRGIPPRND